MSILEKMGSGIDKLKGVFSPKAELEATKARVITSNARRYYDAATKGRRADGWRAIDGGPKEGIESLVDLRRRSRDFVRNNGYARKAVGGIVSNTVGSGIVLSFKGGRSKRALQQAIDAQYAWANSTACDFDGQHTFGGLQALILRTIVESGEVFIRRRTLPPGYYQETKKVPLQIQVLEPEFIDHSKDATRTTTDGNFTVSGIEFDRQGKRVAYWIYQTHPQLDPQAQSVRVKAEEVAHVYRIDRPGQIRGVPWGSAVALNLRDLDLFEDAELVRRKTAAAFCGFITAPEDAENIGQALDANGQPILAPLVDKLEPGAMEYLAPGEGITFTTPPNVTGYAEYVTSMLHKVASGYEVPYFLLTGDFSQMNFSSGRMGWLEFQRLIEQWRWTMLIPRAMDVCLKWFKDTAELVGISFQDVTHEWTPPRREMIDPLKEVQAMLIAVKSGFVSPQEAIKELGYDPDVNVEEIRLWNQLLDKNGITLDSDPRKDPKRMAAENALAAAKLRPQTVAPKEEVA